MNKHMQDLSKRVDSGPNIYPESTAMSSKSQNKKSKVIDARMKLNNYLKQKYEKQNTVSQEKGNTRRERWNSRRDRDNSRHTSYSPQLQNDDIFCESNYNAENVSRHSKNMILNASSRSPRVSQYTDKNSTQPVNTKDKLQLVTFSSDKQASQIQSHRC